MDIAARSTNRVISYYSSQEWVMRLREAIPNGQIDFLMTWRKRGWDATKGEFPEGCRMVLNPHDDGYKAVVAQVVEPFDGVNQEMLITLVNQGLLQDAEVFVVAEGDKQTLLAQGVQDKLKRELKIVTLAVAAERVLALPPREYSITRVKQRFPIMGHPAWQKHCQAAIAFLTKRGTMEPKGTLAELDCGDGAFLEYMRSRFGDLRCTGYCWTLEEKDMAKSILPQAPVMFGMEDSDIEPADFMVCADCEPRELDHVRDQIAKKCKVRGVVTLQKEDGVPDVLELLERMKGWQVIETMTHYMFVLEVANV